MLKTALICVSLIIVCLIYKGLFTLTDYVFRILQMYDLINIYQSQVLIWDN